MGLKIDLGCGSNKHPDHLGVDLKRHEGVDIVASICNDIPGLLPGCAELVRCHHVFEHLHQSDFTKAIREVARLLQPGGKFIFAVPHPSCANAMIQGHLHTLPPLLWEKMRDRVIPFHKDLQIDKITPVPFPPCVEFCKAQGLKFEEWSHFLFDAFFETIVEGHKT